MDVVSPYRSVLWLLRPILWFPTSYMVVIIVHEAAHALTAVALGFPSTLFNFWVNHDFTGATLAERAIVNAAGPIMSLVLGSVCWAIYCRVQHSAAGLPVLFLAAQGVSNFCGNLMSAGFVGDFSNAAIVLGLPAAGRYTVSAIGLIGVCVVLFAAGRELRRWTPPGVGRWAAAFGMTLVPVLLGTLLVVSVNQPTPMGASFLSARFVEGALWVFAAAGMVLAPPRGPSDARPVGFGPADVVAALLVFGVVRITAQGIVLTP